MANSAGGTIVLGVTERGTSVSLDGVAAEQLEKYKKTFWDQQNNRGVINRGIVASSDVTSIEINNNWLLAIRIRSATRHEGDYLCPAEEVRRMFADANDIPADAKILDGYSLHDIDKASFSSFRPAGNAATKPALGSA
jgi:ATP-dependent DNA helicase RecG